MSGSLTLAGSSESTAPGEMIVVRMFHGRVLPWLLRVRGEVISHDVSPALSTNDAQLEVEAVLAGQVIGMISSLSAAPLIRAGRLVPLLAAHATDHLSVHLYYGSRHAQPLRVRAFIDLAVKKLARSSEHALSARELAQTGSAISRPRKGSSAGIKNTSR